MLAQPMVRKTSLWRRVRKHHCIYWMLLPVLAYYVIFHYIPMGGVAIAFQNYSPGRGFASSPFVGLRHFRSFLTGVYAWRVIRNTLLLNVYQILMGFPAPILLALMLHEVRSTAAQRLSQTIVYMPHFISIMVVCGLLRQFSMTNGLFNDVRALIGMERVNLLSRPEYFRTLFVGSGIWQGTGWGTIIYLATLAGVDPNLHEAAAIDGAGRIRRILHVNLPVLVPVIMIQLIMRLGNILSTGFEKVILLYSPATYETADVISSFVYRRGLEMTEYSFGAAVGIFNAAVNLVVLFAANSISAKLTENSLW